jgi:hypothetical protein
MPAMRFIAILCTCYALTFGYAASTKAAEGEPAPAASEDAARKHTSTLDTRIQTLKKEVLDLNRDLFLLEEDLLFPANTQFTVFVSMDIGMLFDLESVQPHLGRT